MVEATEKQDATPICPHCDQPIDDLWFQNVRGLLGRRYIYFCSKCSKVLGVSHRKGFWMG